MEIKEAIHYLKLMLSGMKYQYGLEQIEEEKEIEKLNIDAVEFALASLKTDEAYQLEYENRDCIEVVRCMDCKYWHKNCVEIAGKHGCDIMNDYTPKNGYCFAGVKKE